MWTVVGCADNSTEWARMQTYKHTDIDTSMMRFGRLNGQLHTGPFDDDDEDEDDENDDDMAVPMAK